MTTVHQAPPLLPQFNQGGVPLAGGQLFAYISGTTTKLATYTDYTGTTTNRNPIVLDTNGQCNIWLIAGNTYTFVLSPADDTDPPSNPFWTVNGITGIGDIPSSSGSTTSGVVLQPGDVKWFSGPSANLAPGWLLCNGATFLRTSPLYAAIGTTWGVGDGTTTANLPDLRGRVPAGADNMGGTSASRVTSASIGGLAPAVLGVGAGTQLAQTDTITVTSYLTDPGHSHHPLNGTAFVVPQGSGGEMSAGFAGGGNVGETATATTSTATTKATVTTVAISGLTGTQQNIQPVAFGNWAIWSGNTLYNSASNVGVTTITSTTTTITPNFASTNTGLITISANSILANPTGMVPGGVYSVIVNATTTSTLGYGANYLFFPPNSNASPPAIGFGQNLIEITTTNGSTALTTLIAGPAA